MDFDTIVTNLYLNLAKGDLKTPIKDLRFTQQFIEEKVRSGNDTVFPVDIVLFSRHYNIAWAMEVKDITTSDLDENQAKAYSSLNTTSFRQTLPSHRELDRMNIDVSYQGNPTNSQHIHDSLKVVGTTFPVVVLDVENCTLQRYDNAVSFKNSRLNNAFDSGVDLKIKTINELTNYVKFSPKTNHTIVAAACLPNLAKLTIAKNRKSPNPERTYEFSITELTKNSYASIDIWDKLDSNYRQLLIRSVRDALTQLQNAELDSLKVISGDRVCINIFDINGNVNQQILQSITQKIKDSSVELGQSQSSLI